MRILNCFVAVLLFFVTISAASAQVRVAPIHGSVKYGCFLKHPSNLLVSLVKKTSGKVLVFKHVLTAIAKAERKAKSSLAGIKGKNDRHSKRKRKQLKKTLAAQRALAKAIKSCRDGILVESTGVDCAGAAAGTPCDDLNPCTTNDRCQNLKCQGDNITAGAMLKCGFGKCATKVRQCQNGSFIACVSGAASSEICNGVDDDCNGETDENDACAVVPTPTPTLTPAATPTVVGTPTKTPTPAPTATRRPRPTIRFRTPTPTPTPTPSGCLSAPGTGLNNNATGCACSSSADCCGFCSANQCAGANNVDSAPICFGIVCKSSPGSGLNDNVTGCACTSSADCCGFCSANQCAGANNVDSDPSCP